jgi:negative modulator of initiation of replication
MKTLTIDDDLYAEIDSHTSEIFSHSDVLRKLLSLKHQKPRASSSDAPDSGGNEPGKIISFIQSREYQMRHKAIDKYLAILGWLYKNRPDEFIKIEDYKRGDRVYFAKSEKAIEEGGGGNIRAKRIPDSPFWALVTLDNSSKRTILRAILRSFGHTSAEVNTVVETLPDSKKGSMFEGF